MRPTAIRVARSVVSVSVCVLRARAAVQKRIKRSWAGLAGRLLCVQGNAYYLALPGEYDWTIYTQRLCGLMSNYFVHLLYSQYAESNCCRFVCSSAMVIQVEQLVMCVRLYVYEHIRTISSELKYSTWPLTLIFNRLVQRQRELWVSDLSKSSSKVKVTNQR